MTQEEVYSKAVLFLLRFGACMMPVDAVKENSEATRGLKVGFYHSASLTRFQHHIV